MTHRLDAILAPRSIAVVGASTKPVSLGYKVLDNLLRSGYTGRVYPVNPRAARVHGVRAYPSVAELPEAPEMALVIVPRDAVLDASREAVARGVRALVVVTAGFREVDAEGARLEARLAALARDAGVPLLGPNCMGVINTDPAVSMDASFSPVTALPGTLAFASQSGALGVAVLEAARDRGLGFGRFVSLGNAAGVGPADLLERWAEDPGVRQAALYLETVPDPERFLAAARRLAGVKPLLVLKSGRSAAGARAASSHTGALAAPDALVDGVLRQAGAVRCATVEELVDLALALDRCPRPRGRRVAVLTNAGGPGILATDALTAAGLEVPELPAGLQRRLRERLPREAAVRNPVDMIASASPEDYRDCLRLLRAEGEVDAVLVVVVTPVLYERMAVLEGIEAGSSGEGPPVLVAYMTGDPFFRNLAGRGTPLPVYRTPEPAARALAGALAAAGPEPGEPVLAGLSGEPSRLPPGEGWLEPAEALDLLARAGVPVASWRWIPEGGDLAAAAAGVGFPVALKATGAELVHKTEHGAVVLGLGDPAAVEAAAEAVRRRLAAAGIVPRGWLIQAMVEDGREVIVGAVRDPALGPMVMAGIGGIAVEVFRDTAFRRAPVSEASARRMLEELRGAALLGAFRGRPAADLDALAGVVARIGALAAAESRILELDANPVMALPEGAVVVDVRIRVGPA